MANTIRSWMMVALATVVALLYGGAVLGIVKPQADERMIERIEPIIFVIIGYYFGRLPAQQNENTLREEINRQAQKADAAQHTKEQAQQARESFEEKMKSVRTVLMASVLGLEKKRQTDNHDKPGGPVYDDSVRQSMAAAINILNS
ncbi:MAG: hypothetical protein V7641_1579 [Blastocatellia bacterium]